LTTEASQGIDREVEFVERLYVPSVRCFFKPVSAPNAGHTPDEWICTGEGGNAGSNSPFGSKGG
jgi:hypothetical protein